MMGKGREGSTSLAHVWELHLGAPLLLLPLSLPDLVLTQKGWGHMEGQTARP